ncbi:MAG: aldolase/citrate lyase family protein [Ancalomicrobiaceae bacterium]|nr:aldolase/citrate lyase family protein [Ancalomicrobiaceae bacterium]
MHPIFADPMLCHLIVRPQSRQALDAALAARPDVLIVDLTDETNDRIAIGCGFVTETIAVETAHRPRLYARIPAFAHPESADLLDRAVKAGVDGIQMRGATGGYDATWLDARIAVAEAVNGRGDGEVRMIVEATGSAQAIFGLASYRGASQRLAGLVFTAGDLADSLGLSPLDRDRSGTGGRWRGPFAQARAQAVLAASSAGVVAIDGARLEPTADLPLSAAVAEARGDGFAGLLTDRIADAEDLGRTGTTV